MNKESFSGVFKENRESINDFSVLKEFKFSAISNNFENLEKDKEYTAEIFSVGSRKDYDECLGFLKNKDSILVSSNDAELIYRQEKENFPKGRYIAFIEEQIHLPLDEAGYKRFVYFDNCKDGSSEIQRGYAEGFLGTGFCLVSIKEDK